jgi:hypothetical protein
MSETTYSIQYSTSRAKLYLTSVTVWGQGCCGLACGWLMHPPISWAFTALLTQDAGAGTTIGRSIQYAQPPAPFLAFLRSIPPFFSTLVVPSVLRSQFCVDFPAISAPNQTPAT